MDRKETPAFDALLIAARNLVEYVREHGGPATDLAIALDKALQHYDA